MMMEQQQQQSSTFPNPPAFLWKDFSPAKVSRFEEFRKSFIEQNPHHPAAAASGSGPVVRIPDVPADLANLQPPAEPADGTWRVFGGVYTLKDELPTLEEQGIRRLAPNAATSTSTVVENSTRSRNLKCLAKSVLLNFLELVGVASINPGGIQEKLNDIQTILINMHHAINEYRPHQARESLIEMMQTRLDQIRHETSSITAVTDKAKRVLEGLGSIEIPDDTSIYPGGRRYGPSEAENEENEWRDTETLWALVNEETA